jgi:hypothetical protein
VVDVDIDVVDAEFGFIRHAPGPRSQNHSCSQREERNIPNVTARLFGGKVGASKVDGGQTKSSVPAANAPLLLLVGGVLCANIGRC